MNRRWPTKLLFAFNILMVLGLILSYLSAYVSPKLVPLLPFFGLSFPIWLFGNIVCCVIWLFIKKWMALLSILPIILGINFFFNYWQFFPKTEPEDPGNTQIELMSYNVRLFDLYNWSENEKTRNLMFRQIKASDSDIICFQEFYKRDLPGFFETRDTLVTILKAKNVHEHYTHHLKSKQHFGLATFSVYPIINKGEIAFDNDPNNHCIYTDLKIDEDTIRVYNVHFASIRFQNNDGFLTKMKRLSAAYQKRVDQSRIVLEHIDDSPHKLIICGDFNDTPISYCYRQFNNILKDAFKESGSGIGGTYIGLFPGLRIDYIFHDESLNSYNFKVHPEELSDHRAISCTIEILD